MSVLPIQHTEENPELRIVLVGKTGAGKSSTGNTLIGRRVFDSRMSSVGVTAKCQKEMTVFEGQTLAVVDTPGLFDTQMSEEEVKKEIAKCISFSAPGPHAFLVVIQPNRFTQEEEQTVKLIQELFGEKSSDYTMVLFTHGDDLEYEGVAIETFIGKNKSLNNFIRECHGGYHTLNNRVEDKQQVQQLLQKIHQMVERNGGSYFTNEMLQEAEKAIREKIAMLMKTYTEMSYEEARRQAERNNDFIKKVSLGCWTVGGAAFGTVFGPVGTVVGAATGAGLGFAVNTAGEFFAKKLGYSCYTQ